MSIQRCNYCGSTESHVRFFSTLNSRNRAADNGAFRCTSFGYGVHPTVVECDQCGLVYSISQMSEAALLKNYEAVEDQLYLQEQQGRVLTFQKHLCALHAVTGPPASRRLLDVGTYTGVFVQVARQAGWEAEGLEPSSWAVAVAQQEGLPVRQGTLATAGYAPGSFDVLTMWDVIEHFDEPCRELEMAFQLLKPGGTIVLHTIDVGSVTARLMGSRWPFLMTMHMVYFSRATLRAMLEQVGFQFHSVHTAGRYLSLGYLAGRLEAAFGPTIGRAAQGVVRLLGLEKTPVPINTLDLFTMYAKKPMRNP